MLTFGLLFFTALLVSFILTPLIRNAVQQSGYLDVPSEERKIHTTPIPRVGGMAIFLGVVLPLFILALTQTLHRDNLVFNWLVFLRVMAPSFVIFLLGLADDMFRLSARIKFLVQISAAVLFYFFVGSIPTISNPFTGRLIELGWLALPLTVLWLVGITNAFNLIDGIDGLAAGSALFTTLAVMYTALMTGNLIVIAVTCALAGGILGFLKYNFNPATVFMGDSGSLFIGFTLASLTLQGQKTTTLVAIAIPLVSFGLPILETGLSIARRFLARKPLFSADRGHIHHQLLDKGLSQRQVVILLYGVSAMFALIGLLLNSTSTWSIGLIFLTFGISVWLAVQHLGYAEFSEVSRLFHRSFFQRQLIANNVRIRTVLSRLTNTTNFYQLCGLLGECFDIAGLVWAEIRLPHISPEIPQDLSMFIIHSGNDETVITWSRQATGCLPSQMTYLYIPFRYGSNWGSCRLALPNSPHNSLVLCDLDLFVKLLPGYLEQASLGMETQKALSVAV